MRKAWRLLCILFLMCSSTAFSQTSTEDVLGNVRESVVTVEVFLHSTPGPEAGAVPLPDCLRSSSGCILGTGIVVSKNGDVVTASHVAAAANQLLNTLRPSHIDVQLVIGVSFSNIENQHLVLRESTLEVPAEIRAIDPLHDLALIRVLNLPVPVPLIRTPTATVGATPAWPAPVKFAIERAKDAEPIFACGFPLGEQALVTTNGTIASAWSTETVLTARGLPNAESIDIYKLDIQLTHGNSGGPIFRLPDQAVVGIVIEGSDVVIGAPPVAVPAKYIVGLLTQNGVPWEPANSN
jgi:S1-C subfamily serine protease